MSDVQQEMQADALEAQRFSRKHLVLELDFSLESLAQLENHVDTVEFALRGGKSSENIDLLTRIWGAYVGETIIRQCGATWNRCDDGRVSLDCGAQTVEPHDQVRRRLQDGPECNLVDYVNSILQK